MRWLLATVATAACTTLAWAETLAEEHVVSDRIVRIEPFETFEIMTVGPTDYDQMQVLSGSDVGIALLVGDPDSIQRLGEAAVVAEVAGTQTCDDGDAREYWVVTLGEVPMPVGPLTTCQRLVASVEAGAIILRGESEVGASEVWSWAPGRGWIDASN